MHIAEVVTIAKSLPLLRLNTYKSLILSYSADYRRILWKNQLSEHSQLLHHMHFNYEKDYSWEVAMGVCSTYGYGFL